MSACVECDRLGCPTVGMTMMGSDYLVRCAGHAHLDPEARARAMYEAGKPYGQWDREFLDLKDLYREKARAARSTEGEG